MSADQQRQFPGWDAMYQQQAIETMPWFYPELDDDLRQALDQLGLRDGSALDLGTGPGTQAMQLAQRGFAVTATDISEAAIQLAHATARRRGSPSPGSGMKSLPPGSLDRLISSSTGAASMFCHPNGDKAMPARSLVC